MLIAVVAAVIDAVAALLHRQAHAVVKATELPHGWALEFHWGVENREMSSSGGKNLGLNM